MNEKQAIELLRKYSPDEKTFQIILRHSMAVQKAALKIAKNVKCHKEFIKTASILHDIGRTICPPGKKSIMHGIVGFRILKNEGLVRYARVAANHLGIGIRKEDIIEQKLPLPKRDFVPKTKEELIITYADNLVADDKIMDENYAVERFRKELGDKFAERVIEFNKKVKGLR